MKPIIIPDLHGSILLLNDILNRFPDRHLIFLGDLIDRGQESHLVIARIKTLIEQKQALLCLGNHEEIAIKALLHHTDGYQSFWEKVGGAATIHAYGGITEQLINDLNWIRLNARRVIIQHDVMYCHAMRPPAADVQRSILRQQLHTQHPTLAVETQDRIVLWGRPGHDPLHPLPEGVRYSVHGHTIMDSPQIDLHEHGTVYIDLGGMQAGRFCVWDSETEITHRIV